MPPLTRTRTPLPMASDRDTNGDVTFQQTPDDEGIGTIRGAVTIGNDEWRDMGSPSWITVTIEPGDLLNDGPDPENFRGSGVAIGEPLP